MLGDAGTSGEERLVAMSPCVCKFATLFSTGKETPRYWLFFVLAIFISAVPDYLHSLGVHSCRRVLLKKHWEKT